MTMVVQHLENRLALNSVHPNEQLHEFQIVHALITQCRKQASCEDSDNSGSGYETPSPPSNNGKWKNNSGCREEKLSFVTTIRQTFNAFTQATNSCTKQNVSGHPVSIASTVKNIISQFSRQTCHGSICAPSPGRESVAKRNALQEDGLLKIAAPKNKNKPTNSSDAQSQNQNCSSAEPSTSLTPTLERTQIKSATVVRQSNSNPLATKPKTRSVRARNANRLVRHESAPIPAPEEAKSGNKKSAVSVRRSKSDAVCYTSYATQNRRKIESNVQTKVLHFENCCKGKGQASMCVECRKRSLEELTELPQQSSPVTSRAETIKPKQETLMGALSYHKPSIISQAAAASTASGVTTKVESSDHTCTVDDIPVEKTLKTVTPSPKASKAVLCPGGTFFPANGIIQRDTNVAEEKLNQSKTLKQKYDSTESHDSEDEVAWGIDMQCSQSEKENELSHNSEESKEAMGNIEAKDDSSFEQNISISDAKSLQADDKQSTPLEDENMYTKLCENSGSVDDLNDLSNCSMSSELNNSTLSLNYDSSDNMDSSSSSGESCLSPRQDYLDRRKGRTSSLRPTPSSRYQKMRRKLKKLISRSRSYSEIPQPEVVQTQSEMVQEFLESLRIPTPGFMLKKDSSSSSFDARRQQLAMHFDKNQDWMKRLPDHILVQIFSYMDTRSLAMLKCVCKDFDFLINSYDIRGTDSLWVKDKRYLEDPCRFCRKKFTSGDVSMCRYHAKYYHCDLPYGRSYWMCCFQIDKNAPGCKTGIHNNHWCPSLQHNDKN